MPSDTTMNVNLSRDLYEFVKSAVSSGRFTSASEVVRDALREKRDQALREVERKIEAGLASARRGDLFDGDDVMREVKAMSKARRTASGKK
ncbi:MAG TPA: type II toxin-antitoxin system ParD family antitoxin [Bryobacteraceae bacterium]|nr:type II toxin-antitoxin system ParD family antitoxin [Bryobacteraceae bacterium]